MLKKLNLSLQFALQGPPALPSAARHRAALPRHSVTKWLRHSLQIDADFTVRIVDAAEGQRLNREYRHKDYATNVLTFTYAETDADPAGTSGAPLPNQAPNQGPIQADLVLCAPVIAREAREQKKTLQAHYAHLLVHGALHAQGYDHETSAEDAAVMEQLEVAILTKMGFKNPY